MIRATMLHILEKIGLYQPYTADDVINAEQENALHDHRKVVEQVKEATEKRRTSNGELRKSIQNARRSMAFVDFESLLADHDGRTDKGNRNEPANRSS